MKSKDLIRTIFNYVYNIYISLRRQWYVMRLFTNKSNISRMEATFPNLHNRLRRLNIQNLSELYISLLDMAYIELHHIELNSFIALIKNKNHLIEQHEINNIRILSEKYDEKYFDISERNDTNYSEEAFYYYKISRFLSSMTMYARYKEKKEILEAIYELLFSFDDPNFICHKIMNE